MTKGMVSKLTVQGLTKSFPNGIVANRNVSLEASGGEIHAILGENGAGKTTLMRVVAGLYQPNGGCIRIDGREVQFRNPVDARRAGVAMVHQHFSLVPALSVAENLSLSNLNGPLVLRPNVWRRRLVELARIYGFEIRPDALVRDLSMGERQRVEVFRLVVEGANVLILDEPTSILAPKEAEVLFEHLRKFARDGRIILLVTHKIPHVRAVADRVTVLRAGEVIGFGRVEEFNDRRLSELMVGNQPENGATEDSQVSIPGRPLLKVADVSVKPVFSPYGIADAKFLLHAGEILGVAGVSGNGQDELVSAIVGDIRPSKGKVWFENQLSGSRSMAPAPKTGLRAPSGPENRQFAYIPADRLGIGIAPSLSVLENLCMRVYSTDGFSVGPLLRLGKLLQFAREKISMSAIRPDDPLTTAGSLSGGNVQKLILAREMHGAPSVLIAVNPTAGLDIGRVKEVHKKLLRFARNPTDPAGVVLVSEDLDELLNLCDRVLVVFAGKIVGDVRVQLEAKPDIKVEIGMMMSGIIPHRQGPTESASVQ